MGPSDYLDGLEELLSALEEAEPLRLSGKRREFRSLSSRDRWNDLRSELLVAHWVVQQGIRMEFGAPGQPNPDIILPAYGLGIEVTRRERRGLDELRKAILEGTAGVMPRPRPVVHVTGQPLAIRAAVLDQVRDEVASAARRGDSQLNVLLRPSHGRHPAVTAEILLDRGTTVVPRIVLAPEAANLTVMMLDIEELVATCLQDRRKRMQAMSMPSLLVIDATRLAPQVWLRSASTWSKRLAHGFNDEHAFVGVGLMAAQLGCAPRVAIGTRSVSSDVQWRIVSWARAMGLPLS